jgi:hypothetical protein
MALFIQPPPNATAIMLSKMAMDYNWDDGFAFPQAIADHPNCDLAVALELFWLADAISVYIGETIEHERNSEWRSFSTVLAQRLLVGHYARGSVAFTIPLSKTLIYKYRQCGVPELFLTNFEAVVS